VFEIMSARASRESVMGKLLSLKLNCPGEQIGMFEMVLDMFLTAPKGRPTSSTVTGRMEYLLEKISENE
jgi:hypothetical protein